VDGVGVVRAELEPRPFTKDECVMVVVVHVEVDGEQDVAVRTEPGLGDAVGDRTEGVEW
jgi:hypothetical protein